MNPLEREPMTLPDGTVRRLLSYHGETITGWLGSAPTLIAESAARQGVELEGFHDAGWTSVVAHGYDAHSLPVILKAVPEPGRYRRELATLRHWDGRGACRILHASESEQLLILPAVGQRAGGAARPADHQIRTALRLPSLHRRTALPLLDVPDLNTTFGTEIRPRLLGSAVLAEAIGDETVGMIAAAGQQTLMSARSKVVLHADLFQENVLFDPEGHPVFIDPRGRQGPPAYDWAFWCAFYDPDGFDERFWLIEHLQLEDLHAVATWLAVIAADSLRFQLETGESEEAERLIRILEKSQVRKEIEKKR